MAKYIDDEAEFLRVSVDVKYAHFHQYPTAFISSDPFDTVRSRYNATNFLTNIYKIHHIAREVCGVFLYPASDWYSTSVPVIIYVIS